MATAEDGGATTNAYGGGGAGGKFRKKPFRKATTPYERPAIALRGNSSSSSSWLTKLVVDPASKLISYGARRFFESVFRKRRLPPPPPPPPQTSESNHVLSDARPDAVLSEHAGGECGQPISSYSNGISDLEQLLKEKTFSRSEIDHLTTLLHSRGGEVSLRDDGKGNDERVSDFGRNQNFENGTVVKRNDEDRSHRVDSKVLGDNVDSPSELAKAYMGSRPTNLSPSMLGNYSQVTREDIKMHSNMRTQPVSMSLTTKSPVSFGSSGNGYMAAPRSLGRSAIYNMARTPYSKGAGINHNGHAGLSVPSTSLTLLENSENSEPKSMTLKRRSFVLDDEIGSGGSIRRIRRKSNLIARAVPRTDRLGSKSSSNLVSSLMDDPEYVQRTVHENTDASNPSTSYAIVPSKSNGLESNVVSVRQKSTFQLMPSMLHGQALRSMENATSSELLMNVQDDHKFESSTGLLDAHDSAPQDQGKDEENGPLETSSPSDTYYPGNNSDSAVSFEASLVKDRASDNVENGLPQPQNKKAAFRMSALEDYVDFDDDVPCLEPASLPSSDGRISLEAHLTDSKFPPPEVPKFLATTLQSELKSHPDLVSSNTNEANSAGAGASSLGSNGIITPASQDVTDAARPSIAPPSVVAFNKSKEMNNPPSLFSFGSKAADKLPSSMPESSGRKPETKPDSSSSLLDIFAPSSSPVMFSEPGNGGYLKSLAAEDTNGKSDAVTSAASNVLLVSSTPSGSLTATLNNNTHQISAAIPAIFTPSVSVSDVVPSGTGNVSSAANGKIIFGASGTPKVLGEPPFKFGVSPEPSSNASAASTTTIPAPSSGSSSSSPTNFVAFGVPSSGNMTSGLDSSAGNPSAHNSQGSLFGGASKSFLPAVGTASQGTSTLSNSFASNTNSSTLSSLPAFGFNSSATSSDTGAVASSSGPTSSLFGVSSTAASNGSTVGSSTPSVFSFGLSSSSTSIDAVGSTGGATAPVFGAGLSSSGTTGSFSSTPSSTSAAAPVFSFGANSSGSASVTTNSFGSSSSLTNAVGPTGGAAPSTFKFGLSNPTSASASNEGAVASTFKFGLSNPTSASASNDGAAASTFKFGLSNPTSASASNGGAAPSTFKFGLSSSSSSSAINSVNSNNAPSNPFGSSSQAPSSSIFGSAPATGFSFGAQATSSAPINAAPVVFNSSTAPPSSSPFSFSSTPASVFAASPSPSLNQPPVFGNPAHAFAASSPGNNFQMNGEDSMAEDPVQSATPSGPVFGQTNISPSPSGFMFGSAAPSQPNPFQFGGQQNQAAPQNPFQASSSLEFNAGGSFSLGSSGVDKSGRKFVKVNRSKNRKK